MLASPPKLGKSTLVTQFCAALSHGGEFLGAQLSVGRVLIYCLDEPAGELLRRFDRMGANDDGVFISQEMPESPLDFSNAIRAFVPAIVVIDSLGDWWAGKVDSNSHDETRAFLNPYIRATRQLNVAFWLNYHTNASGQKYAGAVAIGAMVDAPLILKDQRVKSAEDSEELPDDGQRLLEGRTRYGAVRIDLYFDGNNYRRGDARPPLRIRALRVLADRPLSQNELRKILGARNAVVSDVVRNLQRDGFVSRDGNELIVTDSGHDHLASDGNSPSLRREGTTRNRPGTSPEGLGTDGNNGLIPARQPTDPGGNRPSNTIIEEVVA